MVLETGQEDEHVVLRDWQHASDVLGRLGSCIFRGVRNPQWRLESPLEREPWVRQFREYGRPIQCSFLEGGYELNRDNYLARFCEAGQMHEKTQEAADDELWALGRHFGLITPFLDWTKSWRVAAFFALSDWVCWVHRFEGGDDPDSGVLKKREAENPHVSIWALSLEPCPFTEDAFRLIDAIPSREPFQQRQKAQEGVFTQILTGRHFDVEVYLKASEKVANLRKYLIPGCCARGAFKELTDAGIDYARLFPDPEGWAMHSNFLALMGGFGEGLDNMRERVHRFRARTNDER